MMYFSRVLTKVKNNIGSIQNRKSSAFSSIINKDLTKRLEYYSCYAPTPYTIQDYLNISQNRVNLYNIVRTEIPVRLSKLIINMPDYLPTPVKEQRTGQFVKDYFEMSFKELETFPQQIDYIDKNMEAKFLEVLTRVGIRLGGTTEMLSEAILSSKILSNQQKHKELQSTLRKIFRQNLSVDVLVNVYKPKWTKHFQCITCIDPKNNIIENLENAYEDARYLCEQHYINAPHLKISSSTENLFPFIPNHLYLIFFEIFKNSLRATVETHGELNQTLPQVHALLKSDGDRISITIHDEGGGMSIDKISQAMQFFSTSAELNEMSLYQGAHSSPLAGFGFGLGMAKVYSEYFGGSLDLTSKEEIGTDVKICLYCQPNLAKENV